MKKIKSLCFMCFALLVLVAPMYGAYAAECTLVSTQSEGADGDCTSITVYTYRVDNMAGSQETYSIASCTGSCLNPFGNPYPKINAIMYIEGCGNIDYGLCDCAAAGAGGCSNCLSTYNSYSSSGHYYETIIKGCYCGICEETSHTYECQAGYFGTNGNCTQCPSIHGCSTTSSTGTMSVTGCCMAANSCSYSDSKGTLQNTSSCCATN